MTVRRAEHGTIPGDDAGTPVALAALLTGTFVGTLSNGVVNVPLSDILADFDAPLGSGILVVVGFLLTFAAAMPLAGYVGDRFGRRRIYCAALALTAVCSLGAATAPTLEILIAWRAMAGLAAAVFAPAVMGLIAWLFGPHRRARAVGAWASVNGIGQAVGPSVGGLLADAAGWRWVFVPLAPIALVGLVLTLRSVPRYPGQTMRLDVVGAATLTLGAALLILGVTLVGADSTSPWIVPALLGAAVVLLAYAVWHCLRVPVPFIDMRAVVEPRFARSACAAFAQMFALGATLLAIPLYALAHGASTTVAGILLFALPATMALLAPPVGRVSDRLGARPILRSGLITLILAQTLLAVVTAVTVPLGWLAAVLVLTGIGVALVQTPAAAGSTRSAAGAQGTGLGLFNLLRFGGSALSAAWVSVALQHWDYPALFAVTTVIAAIGLAASFLGSNPETVEPPEPALAGQR
ncbi:MFS transporter [Gordonia rhizosphera]|uniref:Putative drug resistance transporter n=1 Tax=Gordonia rhizosphera NBRC 16068 TaxID=1108045 RepID=K6VXA7_9ACTN|nr:MFS transporter [Gordonia rhizosphera]GAB91555.1 putative drug resistance transporter [Gordonia rhizosphera NBRC 16068]